MPTAANASQSPPPTAWELLERHARGQSLTAEDLQAMQVGLFQFWRRERYSGVGASVRERDDVVQDLIVSVLERRWPGQRLLDGRIQTVTPELLATHLQFWLRRQLQKTGASDKKHAPLPEEDLEASELHDEDGHEVFGDDMAWAATQDTLASIPRSGDFESRCYTAARRCVEELDVRTLRAMNLVLGATYLEDAEANQMSVAAQLSVSESTLTRILQKAGINQPRNWTAAIEQPEWRKSPLGRYLIEGCQVPKGDAAALEIALRTLAWCNRDRLRVLKNMQAQPASQP